MAAAKRYKVTCYHESMFGGGDTLDPRPVRTDALATALAILLTAIEDGLEVKFRARGTES